MSKVSVLIATYNVEKYIGNALNSVIGQTLKDIEIIVVDDGSTDGTLQIADQYAALDSRIRVLRHQTNKSLMQVRKTGIEAATGQYIMFLDADDSLSLNACEKAYSAITAEEVDMLQFDSNIVFSNLKEENEAIESSWQEAMKPIPHKMISVSFGGLLTAKENIVFTVWNKIYKRTLCLEAVKHLPNEYVNMSEDVMISFLLQFHAKSYSSIPDKIYDYSFGNGMSTVDCMNQAQLEAAAKNAYIYRYLKSWAVAQKAEEVCKTALDRVFTQVFFDICYRFFYKTTPKQKKQLIENTLRYCETEDIVFAFSQYMYDNHVTNLKCAEELSKLDLFATQKKSVKTVGVFYFRMFNGGVENVISSLSDIWVNGGYRVVLFTDKEPNENDYYINPAVKRVVLPELNDALPKVQKRRITEFRKALIENQVDVMVYNAWVNPGIVLDEMIVKSCGIPFIVHTHNLFCCETDSGNATVSHLYSSLNRAYAMADSVITLTDVDTAWWKALGFRTFKTRNPIQLPFSVEPSALSGKNVLLVARIGWEKNIIDALKIMQEVHKKIPDATLTVLGKGDDLNYVNRVNEYIAEHNMERYITMAGFDTNVLPYYQKSDILLSTAKFEGFGLALMESKICGLPMVCYELPNLDITKEARGMYVIPQGDVEAGADAIIQILEHDDLKKKLGAEARESAREYCEVDFVKLWNTIFEGTVQPAPAQTPLYQHPPLEIAVNIAIDYYTRGIAARGSAPVMIQPAAADVSWYEEQCKVLSNALGGISRSESYRLGLFLTAVPRKIKSWISKLKIKK